MDNLGSRIKYLREKMKLTQQDLGNIVGLHGSNIGRIENGKVFPTSDVLLKISIHFNVSCDWLLTGENIETNICENADEVELLHLYHQLPDNFKKDVKDYIEYQLFKANKEMEFAKSSHSSTAEIA